MINELAYITNFYLNHMWEVSTVNLKLWKVKFGKLNKFATANVLQYMVLLANAKNTLLKGMFLLWAKLK